jgi:oxygen-independent coproporphyrinogen-3 oxidase
MKMDLVSLDPATMAKWNRPVPRYTSYPTAPQFKAMEEEVAISRLKAFDATDKPLSLYIHIPFCKSMCLFCGCSVVLNRNPKRQAAYLNLLFQEIELVSGRFSKKRRLSQLHLGGGTPTSLTEGEFDELMEALQRQFIFSEDAEISIEIDPRTVFADEGKKLVHLKKLGFNRVSFGVQDLDPKVQEAVKRRQSEEMTVETYRHARALGFEGINIDLIYGLPLQTAVSFRKTAEKMIDLRPDRIAFFSYARVPWLKSHQKAIPDEDLPSEVEKFQIYVESRQAFMEGGYAAIGMDHFALEGDSMAIAYREGNLTRNFQGYTVQKAEDLWGLGLSSIGFLEGAFFQNVKMLEEYESRISQRKLPVFRGAVLSSDDLLRKRVIQDLMCRFKVDKRAISFDELFAKERPKLEQLKSEGLAEEDETQFRATPLGRLFIRLVASAFDAYLTEQGQFSRAI